MYRSSTDTPVAPTGGWKKIKGEAPVPEVILAESEE